MIQPSDVMPLLLEASPGFEATWLQIEDENADETGQRERLHYLDAADFVRYLVGLRLRHDTTDFPAVFAVVERLVIEGDEYVRNLGVIGYLEGLQMRTVTSAGLDPETEFRPFVGPVSDRWWERINRFWAGDTTAWQVADP